MSYLKNYPTPISGLTLGMSGIAAFWYKLSGGSALGTSAEIVINIIACALLIPLIVKFIRHPTQLHQALKHPTLGSVVPTLAMTLMLLSHTLSIFSTNAATGLWLFAVFLHIIFLVSFCIHRFADANIDHMVPSWFVPPIGIVVACLTVPSSHFMLLAKIILFFGIIAYGIILPLMLYRVSLGEPIDDARKPTLTIFAAPASLTLSGYLTLIPNPNPLLVMMLLTLSLVMIISVYLMLTRLLRLPFSPANSAFTFPLAISATATFKISLWTQQVPLFTHDSPIFFIIALTEGLIATGIIAYVFAHYLNVILSTKKLLSVSS